MKNLRMYLSAIAVLAIVGSALAFKGKAAFGSGTVFCLASGTTTGACPATDNVNFEVIPNGPVSAPCTTGVPHINSGGDCVNTASGTLFEETLPGN